MSKVLYAHISWYDAMMKLIYSVVYDYDMKKHKHKIFFCVVPFSFPQVLLVFHAFLLILRGFGFGALSAAKFSFFSFTRTCFFQYACVIDTREFSRPERSSITAMNQVVYRYRSSNRISIRMKKFVFPFFVAKFFNAGDEVPPFWFFHTLSLVFYTVPLDFPTDDDFPLLLRQFFRSEVLPRFRFSRVFPPKPFFLMIDFPMFLQF